MKTTRDQYKILTAAAVLLVAGIAATVSFLHIETLAIRYGQPLMGAYLLPLSIDGTVAVSSLAMLRSARMGQDTPWLARSMLLLAVGATLACNVGFGLPHGWPGALLSGWPACAFVGCAEIAIGMTRRKPVQVKRSESGSAALSGSVQAETNGQAVSSRVARLRAQEIAASAVLATNPDLTHSELAEKIGTSERTARRVRDRLASSEAQRDGQAAFVASSSLAT